MKWVSIARNVSAASPVDGKPQSKFKKIVCVRGPSTRPGVILVARKYRPWTPRCPKWHPWPSAVFTGAGSGSHYPWTRAVFMDVACIVLTVRVGKNVARQYFFSTKRQKLPMRTREHSPYISSRAPVHTAREYGRSRRPVFTGSVNRRPEHGP